MTGLVLSLLLAVPPAPTPPPLVPAPPPVVEPAPREPPLQAEEGTEPYGNPSTRIFVTALSGAAASATIFGGSIWFANNVSNSSGDKALLTVAAVPMTLLVAGAVSAGVHRKLDGQGSLWSHIGGMALGSGLGLVIWAVASNLRFSTDPTTTIGVGTATALLAGAGAALMGELSHWRWWNENHPQVALLPLKGGASASFGWSF